MKNKLKRKVKSTEKSTDKRLKNLRPPWKKGDPSPNPKGYTPGKLHYATLRKLAVLKLAKKMKLKPNEVDVLLIINGLSAALKGDYRYYKDDLDRVHGRAQAKVEHSGTIDLTEILNEIRENGTPLVNDLRSHKEEIAEVQSV